MNCGNANDPVLIVLLSCLFPYAIRNYNKHIKIQAKVLIVEINTRK